MLYQKKRNDRSKCDTINCEALLKRSFYLIYSSNSANLEILQYRAALSTYTLFSIVPHLSTINYNYLPG